MRSAPQSVKLRIANVGFSHDLGRGPGSCHPHTEKPRRNQYIRSNCDVSWRFAPAYSIFQPRAWIAGWRPRLAPGKSVKTKSQGLRPGSIGTEKALAATLTETGRSRISRANCPRWPGSARGRLTLGPETARFGPVCIIGRDFNSTGKLPGQRRTTREADLSTQQTGAQAPSRLPRPFGHHRRPQGAGRAPRAGPQASERLSPGFPEIPTWIG
jgi:hypothetical protein